MSSTERPPRPGGGVFYAARALARLGADAHVEAACSAEHRAELVPAARGLRPSDDAGTSRPRRPRTASTTRATGGSCGRTPSAIRGRLTRRSLLRGDAVWVDVCALTRTDFPAETLAALAADGRQLLVDLQGLVRTATIGPLHTDEHIGDVLRHVEVLKLNDEEAETLVGSAEPERLLDLGVPEVILTLGSQGAGSSRPGSSSTCRRFRSTGDVDPTGAGDTYSVTYIVQRAAGAEPVEAARVAARRSPSSSRRPRGGTRRARRRPRGRRTAPASISSRRPSARAKSVDGRPISSPCEISIHSPHSTSPCRQRWQASGPAAEPVAGSSVTPTDGANMRVFHADRRAREAVAP